MSQHFLPSISLLTLLAVLLGSAGCQMAMQNRAFVGSSPQKPSATDAYLVKRGDTVSIRAVAAVPMPEYRISRSDTLVVTIKSSSLSKSIEREVIVPWGEGKIDLGEDYGSVKVSQLHIPEAAAAITRHLHGKIDQPQVSLTLTKSDAADSWIRDNLVSKNGLIYVAKTGYGSVFVAGMTVEQVATAMEEHLSKFDLRAEVTLHVYSEQANSYHGLLDESIVHGPRRPFRPATILEPIEKLLGFQREEAPTIVTGNGFPLGFTQRGF